MLTILNWYINKDGRLACDVYDNDEKIYKFESDLTFVNLRKVTSEYLVDIVKDRKVIPNIKLKISAMDRFFC